MKLTLRCDQCGEHYEVKPYIAARPGNHFCGQVCYGAYQKAHPRPRVLKRMTVACTACGAPVQRWPSDRSTRTFCNRECQRAWHRARAKTPVRQPRPVGGASTYRGANWLEQARLARARDGEKCQVCGVQGVNLPVHHLRPFHLFTDYREANRLDNLTTLCRYHHGKADQAFWREHPDLIQFWAKPRFPVPVVCIRCGASFPPRNNKHRICDACRQMTCEWCGVSFTNPAPSQRRGRYCSRACDLAHRAVRGEIHTPRVCLGCGVTFFNYHAGTRYCSHRCYMTRANPRRQFFAARRRAAQESGQTGA